MRPVRLILILGAISAFVIAVWVYFIDHSQGDLLLSGPPEFIILAIIVAFGAYLRQVSIHASDSRNKILAGEEWRLPPDKAYSKEKMKELDKTYQTIRLVSPYMIGMVLVASGRIVFDSVVRVTTVKRDNPRILYSLDVFLAITLFLAFVGLAIAHFVARRADDGIQRQARLEESVNLIAAKELKTSSKGTDADSEEIIIAPGE